METYYNPEDLKKFSEVGEFQKELSDKFFEYYGSVFKDSALSEREKSIIALGGISKKNLKQLKLTDASGFAGISFFEQKKGP